MRPLAILFAVVGIMISTQAMAWGDKTLGKIWNETSARDNTYFRDQDNKIEGKYSEKFVLRHGQCSKDPDGWSDCLNDRGRVEKMTEWYRGRDLWYKFSFKIDDTWPTDQKHSTIIFQNKVKKQDHPTFSFNLEHGNLSLIFNSVNQDCDIVAKHSDMVNQWTEVVFYANIGDKTTEWMDNPNQKTALWINGKRVDLKCGYGHLLSQQDQKNYNIKGSSARYGLYHSYVSRDLSRMNPEIKLSGWTDRGISSKTNDPWSIDWPNRLPTKTVWIDDMHKKVSARNVWNMNLEIEKVAWTPTVIMMTMADGTVKPMKVLPHMKDHPNPKCKVGLILAQNCQ
jgi:inhibitor of KinA sporulation pathway (predicted exonuclease)